jgi:C5HC2 zinc finger
MGRSHLLRLHPQAAALLAGTNSSASQSVSQLPYLPFLGVRQSATEPTSSKRPCCAVNHARSDRRRLSEELRQAVVHRSGCGRDRLDEIRCLEHSKLGCRCPSASRTLYVRVPDADIRKALARLQALVQVGRRPACVLGRFKAGGAAR